MQLIFSINTEEYETPSADDTVKLGADMLAQYNFRITKLQTWTPKPA